MVTGWPSNVAARSLYLYENKGVENQVVAHRGLYLYENRGLWAIDVQHRGLYLYENKGLWAIEVLARALYEYEQRRDGEVFPWLMKISPTEQYRGGQVDLYGDGFGELLEAAAGSTVSSSSVSGLNIASNTIDRAAAEWISTETTSDAWIRFTFGGAKVVTSIALEGRTSGPAWGPPTFRFSDGGPDVVGASLGLLNPRESDSEFPVGIGRVLYQLATPRTTTYVEIRSTNNGGGNSGRGLREVWIFEDLDQAAETSQAILGLEAMGLVTWSNRSPGLHPANALSPIEKAATVTVPVTGESGLVIVRENT